MANDTGWLVIRTIITQLASDGAKYRNKKDEGDRHKCHDPPPITQCPLTDAYACMGEHYPYP